MIRQVRAAADEGDAAAQVEVASLLEKGVGGKPDFTAAASYYQKAADQGSPAGMSGFGTMLRFGMGVKKDTAAAARSAALPIPFHLSMSVRCVTSVSTRLFAAAAEMGDAVGQVNLGDLHYYGAGVKKDWSMTFKLCGHPYRALSAAA